MHGYLLLVLVIADQVRFSELLKVLVVVPVLIVVAFSLEASDFIEDAKICRAILRFELLLDLH